MADNLGINTNRTYINISRTTLINTQAAQSTKNASSSVKANAQGVSVDFKALLEQRISTKQPPAQPASQSEVVFSKHAMQRVTDRSIDVSEGTITKLNEAVARASQKGVRDALILNGDSVFIVNTLNKTVITALKGSEMKDNVFTNIDGTVII